MVLAPAESLCVSGNSLLIGMQSGRKVSVLNECLDMEDASVAECTTQKLRGFTLGMTEGLWEERNLDLVSLKGVI